MLKFIRFESGIGYVEKSFYVHALSSNIKVGTLWKDSDGEWSFDLEKHIIVISIKRMKEIIKFTEENN